MSDLVEVFAECRPRVLESRLSCRRAVHHSITAVLRIDLPRITSGGVDAVRTIEVVSLFCGQTSHKAEMSRTVTTLPHVSCAQDCSSDRSEFLFFYRTNRSAHQSLLSPSLDRSLLFFILCGWLLAARALAACQLIKKGTRPVNQERLLPLYHALPLMHGTTYYYLLSATVCYRYS